MVTSGRKADRGIVSLVVRPTTQQSLRHPPVHELSARAQRDMNTTAIKSAHTSDTSGSGVSAGGVGCRSQSAGHRRTNKQRQRPRLVEPIRVVDLPLQPDVSHPLTESATQLD